MEQTGYVTKVSDDRIKVRVIRESSCGGNCVSCKGCPSGIQLIECAAYDGASVGDRVILYADSKSVIGGAAVGYAVPAALAILGSVGGFALYSTDISSVLHLLSSYSGVQKVCKNVQRQNQPLKTAPDFYAMG